MTYTANILRVWDAANSDDMAEGFTWYPEANSIAREAGDVLVGAGILSALSPRMPWNRNVALARKAFSEPLTGGALGRSIASVNAIREGADPLSVLGGLKTRAFFHNIVAPHADDEVTVDTHAIKIAGVNADSVGVRAYRDIADSYREAAAIAMVLPQEMQAVTWVAWRNGRRGGVIPQ